VIIMTEYRVITIYPDGSLGDLTLSEKELLSFPEKRIIFAEEIK